MFKFLAVFFIVGIMAFSIWFTDWKAKKLAEATGMDYWSAFWVVAK